MSNFIVNIWNWIIIAIYSFIVVFTTLIYGFVKLDKPYPYNLSFIFLVIYCLICGRKNYIWKHWLHYINLLILVIYTFGILNLIFIQSKFGSMSNLFLYLTVQFVFIFFILPLTTRYLLKLNSKKNEI